MTPAGTPGRIVLREEIRKKLWPNNTVVEFDHSDSTEGGSEVAWAPNGRELFWRI
jgi:hypothetical protein